MNKMNRLNLISELADENEAIAWCQLRGLLNADVHCLSCDEPMRYNERFKFFRCAKMRCCSQIRLSTGTLFEKAKLPVSKVLLLAYEWSVDTILSSVAMEYNVAESTVSLWFNKFRSLAAAFHFLKSNEKIGGYGKIVEIDECLVVKRKYNVGRILSGQCWVFGGVVRGEADQCFIEMVDRRDRETLLDVIRRRIQPGSVISSDCWKAYENLPSLVPEMNFLQLRVNHSRNFVNPDNSAAHTQNIEAFWSSLKRKLKQRGGTKYKTNIEHYIGEHLYKKSMNRNVFETFLIDIARYY